MSRRAKAREISNAWGHIHDLLEFKGAIAFESPIFLLSQLGFSHDSSYCPKRLLPPIVHQYDIPAISHGKVIGRITLGLLVPLCWIPELHQLWRFCQKCERFRTCLIRFVAKCCGLPRRGTLQCPSGWAKLADPWRLK